MKNTIKTTNRKNKFYKIEGLIIYLEKMIKEIKNIYDKFYKNVSFEKIFLKKLNNKFQKIPILNKIPQNQHLEKNILLIKNFLIY